MPRMKRNGTAINIKLEHWKKRDYERYILHTSIYISLQEIAETVIIFLTWINLLHLNTNFQVQLTYRDQTIELIR